VRQGLEVALEGVGVHIEGGRQHGVGLEEQPSGHRRLDGGGSQLLDAHTASGESLGDASYDARLVVAHQVQHELPAGDGRVHGRILDADLDHVAQACERLAERLHIGRVVTLSDAPAELAAMDSLVARTPGLVVATVP